MKTLLIALLFTSSFAQAAQFVVEAKHKLSATEMASVKGMKVEAFAAINDEYFSRLYTVTGNITKTQLQKYAWAKKVEDSFELSRLSLEPSNNPDRIVADELFPYQWALLNQGQTYIREKDDIHNIPLVGVTGKDINWKAIFNKIPSSGKRTIVAVLDSGIDLNHPDLQGNLWKNEKECGKDPKVDNDNNSVPGDCHGYNTADGNADITDNDGHGTHVAGIIAAGNNGLGIVGVNPNALIMPLKVMKDASSDSKIAPSVAFAQGLLYAGKEGADIINLSLGWPRSLTTTYLTNAVLYAIKQGAILVAAAGNNNSSEPLYPCAMEDVICVGSSTLDGSFAGFSNYGGHVDAITPGEGILSLAPTLYEPEFFSVPGYDIKSGTSQSAPLLAGMISILKSQNPTLTRDEVFARLYVAKKNVDKKKYVNGGDVNWGTLAQEVSSPVVRPVLKRVRQIRLEGEKQNGTLTIPVKNFGLNSAAIGVKVESLNAGVEFSNEVMTIPTLGTGLTFNVSFPVSIADLNAESSIKIKVTIINEEGENSYINEIPVVRDVRSSPEFKKTPFVFRGAVKELGSNKTAKTETRISTVDAFISNSNKHDFHSRRVVAKHPKSPTQIAIPIDPKDPDMVLTLDLYSRQNGAYKEAANSITVDKFVRVQNFIRVDLNLDGKEDYLLQVLRYEIGEVKNPDTGKMEKGLPSFSELYFYDADLKPLWPKFPSARVVRDINLRDITDLSFMRMNHPELGTIMVPAFLTQGQIPKIDQVQDFFGRFDSSSELRLYYFEPKVADKKVEIRAVTNNTWKTEVRKQLNASWLESIMIENVLPTSTADAKNGVIRAIMSVGQSTKRQIYVASFDTLKFSIGKALPQTVLQTDGLDPLLSVSPAGLETVGETFMNIYDRSRSKIVTTKGSDQSSQMNYTHISETDVVIGMIASFESGEKKFSVIQTRDELVSLTTINGKVVKTSRPKLRFSFFSASVLSEMYNPVIYNRNGAQAPALYVDSTAVTSNRVNLFEEQDGKLVASVQNSLLVPAGCIALNPRFSASARSHEFIFLCEENSEWSIRSYEMK